MTYFGVSYAADEVIDTSGWSDSAVVRLMRHAPVYFEGGASEPLPVGQFSIGVSGAFYGANAQFVCVEGSNPGTNVSAAISLTPLAANGTIVVSLTAPTLPAGATLQLVYAELDVSNAAGTQVASASTSATVDIDSEAGITLDWDGGLSNITGSDLSLVSGTHIKTTAGGLFTATATLNLVYTPPS